MGQSSPSPSTLLPEIVGAEPERVASPVVGAAAEHSCAPPVELGTRRPGVRFAGHLPAADTAVELAERPLRGGRAAPRRVRGGGQHRRVSLTVPLGTGLQQYDVGSGLGEGVGCHPPAGAAADDADVVMLATRRERGRQPGSWCARQGEESATRHRHAASSVDVGQADGQRKYRGAEGKEPRLRECFTQGP